MMKKTYQQPSCEVTRWTAQEILTSFDGSGEDVWPGQMSEGIENWE